MSVISQTLTLPPSSISLEESLSTTEPDGGPSAAERQRMREDIANLKQARLERLRRALEEASVTLKRQEYDWMLKPITIMIDPVLDFVAEHEARLENQQHFTETLYINMGSDVARLSGKVDRMQSELTGLRMDVNQLQTDFKGVRADVTELKEGMQTIEQKLDLLLSLQMKGQ